MQPSEQELCLRDRVLSLTESKAGTVLYKGHNNPRAAFTARALNIKEKVFKINLSLFNHFDFKLREFDQAVPTKNVSTSHPIKAE